MTDRLWEEVRGACRHDVLKRKSRAQNLFLVMTFMYQQDRAFGTHPVAATSMTECSHPFCTLTPYYCESDR